VIPDNWLNLNTTFDYQFVANFLRSQKLFMILPEQGARAASSDVSVMWSILHIGT